MEWKNSIHNNTKSLVYNDLKEKKNWFLVSFAIIFITVIVMPFVMGRPMSEGFVVMGIAEVFCLVFINCMIDFSYLHDSRKLAYHLSKPITDMQKINVTIISNLIFTAVLMIILAITGYFVETQYMNLSNFFIITIPWLITGIFTAALSSILTGNTIAAGLATVVNFTLPLSFLAIINYFFQITQDIAVGFNSRILFNNFIDNIYRIDILYFVKYADNKFDWTYFLVLAVVLSVLYLLVVKMSKRRKHERSGDFVVSKGYKSLISLLIASLVPIAFYQIIYDADFTAKIISFVILSALAYYLINAVLEKSFKISSYSVKLFIGFMVFFMLFIVAADIGTGKFESKVPQASEISSVYVGQGSYVWLEATGEGKDIYAASEEFMKKSNNVALYSDPENIRDIINLHKELIKNQDYYYATNFNIVYYYKNGEKLYRYYSLNENVDYNNEKDKYILNIINTEEFKVNKLPFVYDDQYFSSLNISSINVRHESVNSYNEYKGLDYIDVELNDIDMNILRKNMKSDYEELLKECSDCISMIMQGKDSYYYHSYPEYSRYSTTSEMTYESAYYIEIGYDKIKEGMPETIEDKEVYPYSYTNYISVRISQKFVNTYEYLESLR
jgi:hypothetical protein